MPKKLCFRRVAAVVLALAVVCAGLAGLTACGDADNFPVTVAGVLIEERPQVVACISNAYTQVIVDMGYATMLDGRAGDCEIPEVKDAEACGTADAPSADVILALGVDLLICYLNAPTETLAALSEQGVTVLQLIPPATRTAFSNLYRCIGSAINGATDGYKDGNTAAQNVLIRLDDVERAVMGETVVNVVIFTSSSLTQGVTGDMLGSVIIELAGGFNIAIEETGGNVNLDNIARSDPDVVLCAAGTENVVRSRRELEDSGALYYNRVYAYDISKFSAYGNDLVMAAWELARLFHPEVVTQDKLPADAIDYIPDFSDAVLDPEENEAYESSIAAATETSTTVTTTHATAAGN